MVRAFLFPKHEWVQDPMVAICIFRVNARSMETQKGKGLSGISVVMLAILWFDIQFKEVAFLGIKFQHIDEWKFMLAWLILWLFFLWRYLQRWGELKEEFSNNYFHRYEKNYKTMNRNTYDKYGMPDEAFSKWWELPLYHRIKFAIKERDFLDFWLPLILAAMGFFAFLFKAICQ